MGGSDDYRRMCGEGGQMWVIEFAIAVAVIGIMVELWDMNITLKDILTELKKGLL